MKYIKLIKADGTKVKIPVLNETAKLGFKGGFILGLICGGLKAFAELNIQSLNYMTDAYLEEQFLLLLNREGWKVTHRFQQGSQVYIEAARNASEL